MHIVIEMIPHCSQRYNTVGDWQYKQYGSDETLYIKVSNMTNPRWEWLVARHELDEALLCKARGITEKEVDSYDFSHLDAGSSDFDSNMDAPYYLEHCSALAAEWQFARELKIDWQSYTEEIQRLCKSYEYKNLEAK